MPGSVLADAYSQARDELTLAFSSAGKEWMVRASVRSDRPFLYRGEGYNRARRNVTTLFKHALGRELEGVRVAERDRIVYFDLAGNLSVQVRLFGPRANVFVVDDEQEVLNAFRDERTWIGTTAAAPHPAPDVADFNQFQERLRPLRNSVGQTAAQAVPLFQRALAEEAMYRAGVEEKEPKQVSEAEWRSIFDAVAELRRELAEPTGRILWRGKMADAFSLVPLRSRMAQSPKITTEVFPTVDAAVSVYVRRSLSDARFMETYAPLERTLAAESRRVRRGADRMMEELLNESRADRYEQWAHLLMASAAREPAGRTACTLPDLFGGETMVVIPLDPSLTAVQNAEAFYERARRTRAARANAEERYAEVERAAEASERLLERLRAITSLDALDLFLREEAEALARFSSRKGGGGDGVPFRRYDLGGGYEVWVGRNAQQNDDLTFHHARKYDLWMHARGVAGSHAVLRLPNRQAQPDKRILERAAAIAAYHSKAQGSGLAPVSVTERKFVRKPRGAAPGAVLIERERVLLVEPGVPPA